MEPAMRGGASSAVARSSSASGTSVKAKRVVKPLTKKAMATFQESHENRGVLYLSRVPPYMKPSALRQQLTGYGAEVLRIYLQPEDTAARTRRIRSGGNKKKSFSEGWVEFSDKRRAKRIASTLNNAPMGGGHRSFYASDLWNIKYLHKFKWHHLTEQTADAARTKQDKMRSEISQAKKEASFYLKKVGQARGIEAMEAKRAKRALAGGDGGAPNPTTASAKRKRVETAAGAAAAGGGAAARGAEAAGALEAVRRSFKQRTLASEQNRHSRIAGKLILPEAITE